MLSLVMCVCCVSFQEEEFELTNFEDYKDGSKDIFAASVSPSGDCLYPAACRVIYDPQVLTDNLQLN